ncbi:MAG: AAA family ATPase [Planctomycetota bacterium]
MIKRIRVVNFMSLGNVSVDLNPLTVFVGRSGSGKTNFVQALRFLRRVVAEGAPQAVNQYGGWPRIMPATAAAQNTARMEIEIGFSVEGVDGDYTYLLVFSSGMIAEEKLSLGSETFFHSRDRNFVVKPKVRAEPNPHSAVLGSISGIQEVAVAHVSLATSLGCYDFMNNVLQNPRQDPQAGLADDGSNFLQAFIAIENDLGAYKNWKEIIAAMRIIDPTIKSIEISRPQKNKIVVSHDVGGVLLTLDLDQESEGIRRFLVQLIALYQSPRKQTLLFEEPEKGIHPGALAALAEQFSASPSAGRGQVLLTTHSPQLLDCFSADDIRVVEMQDYKTRIGRVAPEQLEAIKEKLLATGELLTVDPARLESAPALETSSKGGV